MKVCDKCKKFMGTENPIEIKGHKYELCDICIQRVLNWINAPTGILGMFGGNK